MITVTKRSENRVDIAIDGKLEADMMRVGLDDLIAKAAGVTAGRMMFSMTNISMPTLGAIGVELERLPKLFGLVGKFHRCALLCDESWLRHVAEAKGVIIPTMTIKSFEMSARDDAESWLAEE